MSTSPNMDERIERMNQAAEHGNTDAFYIIIQKDVKLLKHIDKLPSICWAHPICHGADEIKALIL